MQTVNIYEAKTQLSRLLDGVRQGKAFVIAKAGKPVARVIPYTEKEFPAKKRLGFLEGCFGDTAKVKEVGGQEILAMFEDEA
ncbi:MAG TPA: type II toxin-antitoxin system prevent-host-death family antitoxin [Desulfobulbaceae bacterium]|nr:type II toxin-antitoxin system prevent-host-death family antitoxin [Desulfobulbaceae bacterium]